MRNPKGGGTPDPGCPWSKGRSWAWRLAQPGSRFIRPVDALWARPAVPSRGERTKLRRLLIVQQVCLPPEKLCHLRPLPGRADRLKSVTTSGQRRRPRPRERPGRWRAQSRGAPVLPGCLSASGSGFVSTIEGCGRTPFRRRRGGGRAIHCLVQPRCFWPRGRVSPHST